MLIFILVFAFILSFIIFMIMKAYYASMVLAEFRAGNVHVFGRKGKGKDLLFQWVINHEKRRAYSNISYGRKTDVIDLNRLSLEPNTFDNFINGVITKIPLPLEESRDVFISDAGLYFPCQCDHALEKKYPSFPIAFALSRHLYNSNIHTNSQGATRVWKLLREQADSFIQCRRAYNLGLFFIVKGTIYLTESDAVSQRRTIKARLFHRQEAKIFNASIGAPRDFWIVLSRRKIHYNTRYFRSVFDVQGSSVL
jgi:hypothetical protein